MVDDYPHNLALSNDVPFLPSHQKPAVSEISMISGYCQAQEVFRCLIYSVFLGAVHIAKVSYIFKLTIFLVILKIGNFILLWGIAESLHV